MFGKSNGSDPSQPQSSGSLWGDVFGLSGLMKVITDPALVNHAHAMMQATIDGAHANRRIEAKLDRLLRALGHEINDINSRFPDNFQPGPTPPLLEGGRADGTGGNPPSSELAHDGNRGASASVGTAGGADELRRNDDPAGELR
jgi:hypothetical protein